jgi:hypothetical protein
MSPLVQPLEHGYGEGVAVVLVYVDADALVDVKWS